MKINFDKINSGIRKHNSEKISNSNNNYIPNVYNSNTTNLQPIPIINIFGNNKEVKSDISSDKIIKKDEKGNVNTMVNTETSYIDSYKPILNELNDLNIETKEMMDNLNKDIEVVRKQNTKNKYNNLSALISASTSLVGSRLNIIKEAGNIISNSHNMDLKRYSKKSDSENKNNDDELMMNLYQMMSNDSNLNIVKSEDILSSSKQNNDSDNNISKLYSDYVDHMNSISSEVVVVYNCADDTTRFSAIDINGNLRDDNPNIPEKHYLSNIIIDRVNNIAKDKHLGDTYKLIVLNESINDEEVENLF